MSNAYQVVPTFPDAFYTEVVNLEGTDYALTFNYSQRENCYYLSVALPDGTDLVNGVKVCANIALLSKYADDRLPPGELICMANTPTQDPPPGLGQIGDGQPFQLLYIPTALLPGGTGP